MFVTETVKIMKFRFGVLKKIGDKVSSKLNIFSSMVLQCWLNILENNIIIYYVTEKHSSWAPGHSLYHKILLAFWESDETF